MDNMSEGYFISQSKVWVFLNEGTFSLTSYVQDLPVTLKCHDFQSLEKALTFHMELKFCKREVYFLNGRKKCVGGHLLLLFSV